MATKDTNIGLLSKMAKFVRNPTTDWSDLGKPEPVADSGYNKQALKEMIERKRQNDFVRRREFDYLRKLRRNGLTSSMDQTGRPSFFQSSSTSNIDERATTIKKIDEIEAHMSKQWWRGKQDEVTPHEGSVPVVVNRKQAARDGAPLTYESTQCSELDKDADSIHGTDYESTQMGLSEPDELALAGAAQQAKPSKNLLRRERDSCTSGFTVSKLFSIELEDGFADPDLEEAAIRFANGDDVGAEAGLVAALQADNVNSGSAGGWAAALFDLYRATGQQASFDRVAIDYALRFGCSAPAWFSTPDLLGRKTVESGASQLLATELNARTAWECPPTLDFQALQALFDGLLMTPSPWRLSWSRLHTITPQAAKALAELFGQWCAKPVKLFFSGTDVLEKNLRSMTPSGDKQVDSFWWQLRLDALRILRLQDEFELAALDFCVTYEVSPPPWRPARCEVVQDSANALASFGVPFDLLDDVAQGNPEDLGQMPTVLMGQNSQPPAVVELSGEVLGDAVEALNKLQGGLMGSNRLVISCARLIRVDFSAAGSILNWVAVRESEGCLVQFHDVPRLVAAFFNVIGINEHAQVVLRTS